MTDIMEDIQLGDTIEWTTPIGSVMRGVVTRKRSSASRAWITDAGNAVIYDTYIGGEVRVVRRKDIDEPQEVGAVVQVWSSDYASDVQYLRIAPGPRGWFQMSPGSRLRTFEDIRKASAEPVKLVEG